MNTSFSIIHFIKIILVLLVICACAPVNDGIGKYRVESVGNAYRSTEALVLSVRPVMLHKQNSGAGSQAGGMIGGALAAENSDNVGVIIAGIVAGAIVGDSIETSSNTFNGHEYVIQTKRGVLLTVAQIDGLDKVFSRDDKVILVYGHPHRLIEDPR